MFYQRNKYDHSSPRIKTLTNANADIIARTKRINNRDIAYRTATAFVGILGGLAIAYYPPFGGLSIAGMQALGTIFFMVIFLAFRPIPMAATALLTLWIFWALLNIPVVVVFTGYTNPVFWFIFSALTLSVAAEKSGLAKRIAYAIVSRVGFSSNRLLAGFVGASLVSIIFIPDGNARTAVLMTIVIGFLTLMKVSKDSPLAKRLGVTVGYLNVAAASTAVFTANAIQIAAVGVLNSTEHLTISYVQWSLYAAVPALLAPLLAVFFLVPRIFKVKQQISESEARETVTSEARSMGKISTREVAILVLIVAAIVLWATGSLTSISVDVVGLIVAILLFTPLGGVKISDIPNSYWAVIFFNGTLFALPGILGKEGVSAFIAKNLTTLVNSHNPAIFSLSIGLVALLANATLSNLAAIGIILPSLFKIGTSLGFSPIFVTVLFSYATSMELFYYMNGPSITALGFGLYSVKDWMKLVSVLALIQLILIPVYALTYWHIVGLV